MRSRSRACEAALARSRRYLRSTLSMNAERECLDPAKRSIFSKTSFDSLMKIFSFILLSYSGASGLASCEVTNGSFCHCAGAEGGAGGDGCQEIDWRWRRGIA